MSSSAIHETTSTLIPFWNEPSTVGWQNVTAAPDTDGSCIESRAPRSWLYRAGDEKDAVYYIEAGVVLVSRYASNGSLIESRMAFSGEYLGLGFLAKHRSSAVTAVACTVTCYTIEEFEALCEQDATLRQVRDDAVRKEFEQIRGDATDQASRSSLTARVSNLLSVASRLAELEGRSADLSAESLDLNQLSDFFRVGRLEMLTSLHRLERNNLISYNPGFEIKIFDCAGLETFANADPDCEISDTVGAGTKKPNEDAA